MGLQCVSPHIYGTNNEEIVHNVIKASKLCHLFDAFITISAISQLFAPLIQLLCSHCIEDCLYIYSMVYMVYICLFWYNIPYGSHDLLYCFCLRIYLMSLNILHMSRNIVNKLIQKYSFILWFSKHTVFLTIFIAKSRFLELPPIMVFSLLLEEPLHICILL